MIKLRKRLLATLITCCMLFSYNITCFASETTEEYTITSSIAPKASTAIGAGQSATLNLGSVGTGYVNLRIITASDATSGTVTWNFYRGTLKVKSGSLSVNDMRTVGIAVSSGNYSITLTNTCSKTTTVFAYFV